MGATEGGAEKNTSCQHMLQSAPCLDDAALQAEAVAAGEGGGGGVICKSGYQATDSGHMSC